VPTLTLGELDSRVLDRLDQNTLLYKTSERYAAINEGIQVLNCLTGFYQQNVQFPYSSQQNRVWYDVPAPIVIPTKLTLDGVFVRRSTLLQLSRSKPDWVTDTTYNQVSNISSWGGWGLQKIFLHPADSIGGQTMVLTGVVNPPTLVNPSDSLNAPNWLQSALDLYCSHVPVLKESSKSFAEASKDLNAFYRLVKKQTQWLGWAAPKYWVAEAQQPTKRG
jgi:hypothetical protein